MNRIADIVNSSIRLEEDFCAEVSEPKSTSPEQNLITTTVFNVGRALNLKPDINPNNIDTSLKESLACCLKYSVGGLLDSGLNGTVRRNNSYFVNISLLLAVILNVYSLPACWINNFFVSPSNCLLETFSGARLRRVTFFWIGSFITTPTRPDCSSIN